MSSDIPQIPQPVPFTFHRGKDKTYTTVYQAVDFPLDHFAIFKQNPVNRDRITEANKMLYSLQKQINELREALIALAITVDENVEKKVTLSLKIGNEAKDIEGTLLKDEYTFTITGVEFGNQESITATAQIDESNYIEVEGELSCAEGDDVEVKGKAKEVKEGEEPPVITIKKSTEPGPEPTEDLTFTIKIGDAEATEMSTEDHLTFHAEFEAQQADTVIILTASKAGYKLVGSLPSVSTQTTSIDITVEADETATDAISETITVSQA